MSEWSLVYEEYDPDREGLREALCTLGNGYFCTRGAFPWADADGVHYPGTYLAGGYNRLKSDIAGEIIENEDLVNMPNWLALTFRVEGGRWFSLRDITILSYRQELDMMRGLLLHSIRFRDGEGRETRLEERRMVSMNCSHCGALEMKITAENWSGILEVRSSIDGTVKNNGVPRYQGLEGNHIEPLWSGQKGDDIIILQVRTVQSRLEVSQSARTKIFQNGAEVHPRHRLIQRRGFIGQHFFIEVGQKDEITVEKIAFIYTSGDTGISESSLEAGKSASDAKRFDRLLEP
ncbi:MAG: trehalose-phosphatase, partial [Desulfovibrionales bacterium]